MILSSSELSLSSPPSKLVIFLVDKAAMLAAAAIALGDASMAGRYNFSGQGNVKTESPTGFITHLLT